MSKIEAAILAATGLTAKRNEDRQEYLKRIVRSTAELPDEKWNALAPEAQEWFNKGADNMNNKKAIDDFPDIEKPAETAKPAEAPVARRGASTPPSQPAATAAAGTTDAMVKPNVGDTVLLTNDKGLEFQGVVKTVDDNQIELDSDDVLKWTKVKACKVLKTGAPAASAASASSAPAEKPAEATKPTPPAAPATRRQPPQRSAGGVSVTQQMREMICKNIGKTKEEVAGLLKEAGVEFRDSTLDIMYADTTKTIDTLKTLGKLAA